MRYSTTLKITDSNKRHAIVDMIPRLDNSIIEPVFFSDEFGELSIGILVMVHGWIAEHVEEDGLGEFVE